MDVRTRMIWTVGRYQVNGPDDVPAVNALQDKTFLIPLNQRGREKPTRVKIDPKDHLVFTRNDLADAEKYFTVLNEMLRRNPFLSRDEGILNLLREIGFHPSQRFDRDSLDQSSRKGLLRAVKTGHEIVSARTKSFARVVDGWMEPFSRRTWAPAS